MKKSPLLIILLLSLLGLALAAPLAQAQDPYPTPPPIGSTEDNLCNKGGQMEVNCITRWHWECGWYLARFFVLSYNQGGYNISLVPLDCRILLPPPPAPVVNFSAAAPPADSSPVVCPTVVISEPIFTSTDPAYPVTCTCAPGTIGPDVQYDDQQAFIGYVCYEVVSS